MLGVKLFLLTVQKCKKAQKSKILKNNGHFRILHPQISFKEFSIICENVVYFFYCAGGGKVLEDFRKAIQ